MVTPAFRQPSTRISYEIDVLKSLSNNVASGLASLACANTHLIRPTRPKSLQMRVIALSYLSKIGMITTSLIASQISMTPLKSVTSRVIRAICFL